ncbi:MAG: autotransporter-associated beta strand repeat-containing protein [Verrucomicrobia bacterium]|nr:autotransporter-associated beta strand repeat-containing protein [Verrucomicrobiota bacterium]
MKILRKLTLLPGLALAVLFSNPVHGATVIIGDNYNVTSSGTGFGLGSGVNTGINPPTTRLTGSIAAGLRYMNTGTKATTAYDIPGSKLRVVAAANAGRFTLSANGTTPFDFAPALGIEAATPANPVVYDVAISMDNDSTGVYRTSFALGTGEGDATTWDFGVQLYRAASGNNFYTIGKRIDTGSSGLGSDLNAAIHTMGANTYGTEITLLMRVTDAGMETTTYNSRVQLSLNGGSTWFYDTASDSNLAGTGWRLDGTARYIMWDIAPNAGNVRYDNFSLTWISGPQPWTGNGANGNWSTGGNWGGMTAPVSGDSLTFKGTTRQSNTNNITGLTVPWVTFNNGGFALYGNELTISGAITNLVGNNTFKADVAWGSTSAKDWSIASGSEVVLDNTTSVEVSGAHAVYGGGTLRVKGSMAIGAASLVNPPFLLHEGKHIVDGGTFSSRGGYRIGSQAIGSGAQMILTNGATFALTTSGGNLRVGDSANPVTSRLEINNSTLTMAGGHLGVAYSAGSSGDVSQTGGLVSGCTVNFSQTGAGTGTYTIKNGVVEPIQIKKTTSGGDARIYFDNAILRTASGANSAFMTGLNLAQIQAGGLTIDATSDVIIGQALTGSGALTKSGGSKVTLTGANTYSGGTLIRAGTLAIGTGGSIASPTITITNGTTFDVSAVSGYALTASQTLVRNFTSGVGNVNGSITLNSGAKVSLQANGTGGTVGAINVTGGLTLNANTITINVIGSSLGAETYPLINYTGSKSGSFNATPTITGSGLGAGLVASILETSGQISLKVIVPPVPPHGVAAANIQVVQHDLANNVHSVTATTTTSINGFKIREGSNRGDINVQIGSSSNDDVETGVMITSVAENGRNHGEDSGMNYCTSSMAYSRGGANGGSFFIPIANTPDGQEYNINVSAAFFPFTNWLAGHARNSTDINGGPNNLFTGSPGLSLGTHFVDNGGGISTVNLTSLGINSTTDGILLVTHARNEGNRASSVANANGTWTVHVRDNAANGAETEQDPVVFVFVPKSNASVISGKFQGDGGILMHNGPTPRFSLNNVSTGNWLLTIPGHTPNTGVLVLSPEGGDSVNQDNIVSFQPSGSGWMIQSRDLPGNGLQTPAGPVASFAFIPAPMATLVSPANNVANVASSPTLKVAVVNPAGGNVKVTFHGHQAPKPYPGRDFLIPVLPDTQNYARENSGLGDATKEMWFAQTDWIANNRVSQNIAYVATLGDCVQNGDIKNGNPNTGEWRIATNAMYRLEKQSTTKLVFGIPYGITVGNHDQQPAGDPNGTSNLYNQYFGISHFSDKPYYGGHFGSDNDNWFDLFSAGGMDFIVFSFEYGRYGSAVLNWANAVLATNQNRRVIVLTHHAGSDSTPSNLSNQGSALYQGLKENPNFFLMLGGHVFNNGGEGSRANTFNGKTVRTLVSNYQGRFNGGNGLMRLMYFSPSNNIVNIKTYSPYTGNYETDADSQFSFSYNMQPNGAGSPGTAYVVLGTNLNVVPGTQSSIVWSGLQASKTYEWYVTVTDEAGDYSTSSEWRFTTTSGFTKPAFTDENDNGISDEWEAQYGITDPDADDDGDGQSNRAEYLAKTNPKDAASLLRILSAEQHPDGNVTLTWSAVGGVRYRIQCSDGNPTAFADTQEGDDIEMDAETAESVSTQSFTDTFLNGAPINSSRFYRIKVVSAD